LSDCSIIRYLESNILNLIFVKMLRSDKTNILIDFRYGKDAESFKNHVQKE